MFLSTQKAQRVTSRWNRLAKAVCDFFAAIGDDDLDDDFWVRVR